MSENIDNNNNIDTNTQTKCVNSKLPCAKFCVAVFITVGSAIFGASMLATGGLSATGSPFYAGLLTGAISYWASPPSSTGK